MNEDEQSIQSIIYESLDYANIIRTAVQRVTDGMLATLAKIEEQQKKDKEEKLAALNKIKDDNLYLDELSSLVEVSLKQHKTVLTEPRKLNGLYGIIDQEYQIRVQEFVERGQPSVPAVAYNYNGMLIDGHHRVAMMKARDKQKMTKKSKQTYIDLETAPLGSSMFDLHTGGIDFGHETNENDT